jgi:hypothetical protein
VALYDGSLTQPSDELRKEVVLEEREILEERLLQVRFIDFRENVLASSGAVA